MQNPQAELKTGVRPRRNSSAPLYLWYRYLERWSGVLAEQPDARPRSGIGRTCFATRASMRGFKGKYDGMAKRYQCVAELMLTSQPRGTQSAGDQIIGLDRSGKYVGTRRITTTELGHRACRLGPLPSLCCSGLGRGLERGELSRGCHQRPIARQVLTV